MNMKKQMVTLAVVGMMSLGAVVGAAAAGVGYVNVGALIQGHSKMAKAELSMKANIKSAQERFEKEEAKLKTDEEKGAAFSRLQNELAEKEQALLGPIYNDVMKAIEDTRKQKDLDIIIAQESVVAGGIDVTADAAKNLK